MTKKLLALIEMDREEMENRTADLDDQHQQTRALFDKLQMHTTQRLRLNEHTLLTLQSQLNSFERRLTKLETTTVPPTDMDPANS